MIQFENIHYELRLDAFCINFYSVSMVTQRGKRWHMIDFLWRIITTAFTSLFNCLFYTTSILHNSNFSLANICDSSMPDYLDLCLILSHIKRIWSRQLRKHLGKNLETLFKWSLIYPQKTKQKSHILSGLFLTNHWVEFNKVLHESSIPRDVHTLKVLQLHVNLQSYSPFTSVSPT